MNRLLIPFLFIASLFTTACSDDEPKDTVKEIAMSVSPETGIMYGLFDDKREHPIECMLVMTEDEPDRLQSLAFGAIEGFTYERGHEYELRVKKTVLANPPMDAVNCTYSLVRILMDRLVLEPQVPADKEITSEEDIEYYDLCPINKYAVNTVFHINDNGELRYADGSLLPSYDAARIWLENILDKADPNWIKLQSVPYMAIYSYVLSPLTNEIRLIRNESSGPMFKNVIPESEFRHITQTLKSGEELHYALILSNIHKLALQKVEFTVKKQ